MSPFDRLGHVFTADQIAALEECYPHRCPDPNDSAAEMWMKAGERRLVDVLKAKVAEAQEENILTSPISSPQQ